MSLVKAFFYGWFMDPDILKDQGLSPSEPTVAKLPNYKFTLGQRASMTPAQGQEVWGTIIKLSQDELDNLYSEPSVAEYEPIDVVCMDKGLKETNASTYILPPGYDHVAPESSNYVVRLYDICCKLGLPDEYCMHIKNIIAELDDKNKE